MAAIVEAAARILETEGFDGYTTNAVAERAGVSIGSLYQYFPGKDAITRALIARETAALVAEVDKINAQDGGRAALERLVAIAVAHQLQRPRLARLLDLEEMRLPVAADMAPANRCLSQVFHECLAAPDLGGLQPARWTAMDLVAIIKGMIDAAGARGERDQAQLGQRVNRAVRGYLKETTDAA